MLHVVLALLFHSAWHPISPNFLHNTIVFKKLFSVGDRHFIPTRKTVPRVIGQSAYQSTQ